MTPTSEMSINRMWNNQVILIEVSDNIFIILENCGLQAQTTSENEQKERIQNLIKSFLR